MNVAVGRLQVTVTVAPPARESGRRPAAVTSDTSGAAERAYHRQQMRDAVEEDRNRWDRVRLLHTPARFF